MVFVNENGTDVSHSVMDIELVVALVASQRTAFAWRAMRTKAEFSHRWL